MSRRNPAPPDPDQDEDEALLLSIEEELRWDRPLKRYPGASRFTQEVYRGLARRGPAPLQEIEAALPSHWWTSYMSRLYDLKVNRQLKRGRLEYGSPAFEVKARRWYLRRRLVGMQQYGIAIRQGDQWDAGRPPLVLTKVKERHIAEVEVWRLRPLDLNAEAERAAKHESYLLHQKAQTMLRRMLKNGRLGAEMQTTLSLALAALECRQQQP